MMMLNGIIIQVTDMMLLVTFLSRRGVLNTFNVRLSPVFVTKGNMSNANMNIGNMTSLKLDEQRE